LEHLRRRTDNTGKFINKRRKIMLEVNVKQVRSKLGQLLRQVERGHDILLTKHGKEVACLVPPQKTDRLPSLKEFRRAIAAPEQSLSRTVLAGRDEERH
jgi:prevent-host-death family protein